MDSRGRALNSLAELVAFRNRYMLYGTRARYFVHAERDDLEHRLTFHGYFAGCLGSEALLHWAPGFERSSPGSLPEPLTAPFGRPRVS